MSSVSGSSVGNMPPRHGKKLADVMDDVFKSNLKEAEEAALETNERRARTGTTEAPAASPTAEPAASSTKAFSARKIEGYTVPIAYPPQPCERCVRSKRTCKGIAGARCEHCKALHQKCSNSTGPPRGRHAGTVNPPDAPSTQNKAGPSTDTTRTKRRVNVGKSKLVDSAEEGEDDANEKDAGSASKKRRISSDFRANVLKDIAELEGAIKKTQTNVTKDLTKLSQLAASLAVQIRATDN